MLNSPSNVIPKHLFPQCYTVGFELEYSKPDMRSASQQAAITRIGEIKYDGTVSTGFELASRVFRWNDFTGGRSNPKYLIWQTLFKTLQTLGASVESKDGAGMHVHIGKEAVNSEGLYFCNLLLCSWAQYIQAIGERTFTRFCQNVANTKGDCEHGTSRENRYRVLNVAPETTVELRFFKSTVSLFSFLKNVQFALSVFHFVAFCAKTGNPLQQKAVSEKNWLDYLQWCSNYFLTYPVLCKFYEQQGFLASSVEPTVESKEYLLDLACAPANIRTETKDLLHLALKTISVSFPVVKCETLMHAAKHVIRNSGGYTNALSLMSWVNGVCNTCAKEGCDTIRVVFNSDGVSESDLTDK